LPGRISEVAKSNMPVTDEPMSPNSSDKAAVPLLPNETEMVSTTKKAKPSISNSNTKEAFKVRHQSQYTIFQIVESKRIILSIGGSVKEERTVEGKLISGLIEKMADLHLPALPQRFAHLEGVLPRGWFVPGLKKSHPHKKTHGAIPFAILAQKIQENYKTIDRETLLWCTNVALLVRNRLDKIRLKTKKNYSPSQIDVSESVTETEDKSSALLDPTWQREVDLVDLTTRLEASSSSKALSLPTLNIGKSASDQIANAACHETESQMLNICKKANDSAEALLNTLQIIEDRRLNEESFVLQESTLQALSNAAILALEAAPLSILTDSSSDNLKLAGLKPSLNPKMKCVAINKVTLAKILRAERLLSLTLDSLKNNVVSVNSFTSYKELRNSIMPYLSSVAMVVNSGPMMNSDDLLSMSKMLHELAEELKNNSLYRTVCLYGNLPYATVVLTILGQTSEEMAHLSGSLLEWFSS